MPQPNGHSGGATSHLTLAVSDSELQQSIPARFQEAALKFAKNLAVEGRHDALTYQDLNARANRLTNAILALDARPVQPIIILVGQSTTFIIAVLAVLKAGKIYVPLEPTDPLAELLVISKKIAPGLIISDQHSEEIANQLCTSATQVLLADEVFTRFSDENPKTNILPDQLATIYLTSGTTGQPKGVMDIHRNILHNSIRYAGSLSIGPTDRHTLMQSPSFSGTASTIFSCLLNGASVLPFDLRKDGMVGLVDWIRQKQITIWHSVPLIFEQAVRSGLDTRSIRLIRMEGDQMYLRHFLLFKKHFGPETVLVNGLGTTETGLVRQFFVTPGSKIGGNRVPLGYPVPDMEVTIRTPDGNVTAPGEIGEIYVCSGFLAKGYWRRPDLTSAKFDTDPTDPVRRTYRTGDLGILQTDGCLEYLGRKEFQAKIKGRMIDFSLIEQALCQVSGVKHALVGVDETTTVSQQLVAYVVAEPGINVTVLRNSLSQKLAEYLVPSHFVLVEKLPSDRHGKLSRTGLPQRSFSRPNLDTPFRSPRSILEQRVANCFGEVLKVEPIGLDDNFFELGGDSLLATALSALLEERLERVVFPDCVFDNPTVAKFSEQLDTGKDASSVYALRETGDGTPLFCVNVQPDQPSGFWTLAHLIENQTVYVLRAGQKSIHVESMAREYLVAMRSIQPHGPYQICGNCFGGVVAFEMAQQLHLNGETVSMLALIDTAFPPRQPNLAARARVYKRSWRQLISKGQFKARIARLATRLGILHSSAWLDIYQALRIAELQYKPLPYEGPTFLFIAGALSNQEGWRSVITNGLEIVQIADTSWDNEDDRPHLTAEPLVQQLAHSLRQVLGRSGKHLPISHVNVAGTQS